MKCWWLEMRKPSVKRSRSLSLRETWLPGGQNTFFCLKRHTCLAPKSPFQRQTLSICILVYKLFKDITTAVLKVWRYLNDQKTKFWSFLTKTAFVKIIIWLCLHTNHSFFFFFFRPGVCFLKFWLWPKCFIEYLSVWYLKK